MKYPVKINWKTEAAPLLLVIAGFALSYFFYNRMPEIVPTHWNFAGEPDDWSSRGFAAFFFPFLNLGIYLLFLLFPMLDPKKERYADFAKPFHVFKGLLVLILTLIYFASSLSGMGYNVPIDTVVPIGIGLLFIALGNYFGKIKMNWMMGIRTPWTLSSEEVWNRTHRMGGKLFMLAGVLMILEAFMPDRTKLPVFIAAIALAALAPIVYSYILYRRLGKG